MNKEIKSDKTYNDKLNDEDIKLEEKLREQGKGNEEVVEMCKKTALVKAMFLSGVVVVGCLITGAGCTTTVATLPDGSTLESKRFLMKTVVEADMPTTNGVLKIKLNTAPDAQLVEAVARGVASGLKP